MKIVLSTWGTLGDVIPFIRIGTELKRRGFLPILVANERYEKLARLNGLEFIPDSTEAAFDAVFSHPDVWHPRKGLDIVFPFLLETTRNAFQIIKNIPRSELIGTVGSQVMNSGILAQESLGIPTVTVILSPLVLRSVHSPAQLQMLNFPDWIGKRSLRIAYFLLDRLVGRQLNAPMNRIRCDIGLKPSKNILQWMRDAPQRSIALWPDWFYSSQIDWPSIAVTTGFLGADLAFSDVHTDSHFSIPLADPRPFVFLIGSNPHYSLARQFFAESVKICQAFGRPGILLTPSAEQLPLPLPNFVRHIPFAPMAQLLSNAAAVIHPGGIGTIGIALKAGIPQVIVPISVEQFENGHRLEKLKAGRLMNPKSFTLANIKPLLESLLTPAVSRRCHELSMQVSEGKALLDTCDLIQQSLRPLDAGSDLSQALPH